MEKLIKMQMENSQGKLIIKEVPKDLSAFYKNSGWDFYKETKKIVEEKTDKKSNRGFKK